jgi:simple sugar transport system permease protein
MGISSFLADLVVSVSLLCVLVGSFISKFKLVRAGAGKR